MNEHDIIVVGVLAASLIGNLIQYYALSYYKGYYDQKQRDLELLAELRKR